MTTPNIPSTTQAASATLNGHRRQWWKETVVYQVWPRSFMDSNGDGIGDLQGIIQRLDHIADLGVELIWLSPHFDSPNVDNGYDIRDYRKVLAEFGSMADFDELLSAVKARSMRLIIDLVVNHSSDEHSWFVQSRKSRDNPYRDYYLWHPGREGREPNDWQSFFSGSAWQRDAATGEYYMHLFAAKQPDLNWDNPTVRAEVYDLMRFWLDKGVDGFRMDVIAFISKDPSFPDYPQAYRKRPEYYHASGPRLHDYLQEIRREVLCHYDVVAVGEAFGVTFEQAAQLVDERRDELDMLIHFDAVRINRGEGWHARDWSLPELKAVFAHQDRAMDQHTWRSICLSNHDNPRMVSTFGDPEEPYRIPSAKLLALLLFTLKGTPFVYQGDELGMTNYPFTSGEDFDDVEVKNAWQSEVLSGRVGADEFLSHMLQTSRDQGRTPVQWDDGPNGGFSTGKPWFPVNPNSQWINARQAHADPDSIYHFYARLIALRKSTPALIYGDYTDLQPGHPSLYVYTRAIGTEVYLIILNFSRQTLSYRPPVALTDGELLISNLGEIKARGQDLRLRAWEARLYRCWMN